ncbi:MAG TPA: DNA/RNA non-specific endonuclease [Allosphingosinicella sp.]|jgi:endonuclease G
MSKLFWLTASVAVLVATPLLVQPPADAFAPKKAKLVAAPSPATCNEDYLGGQPPKIITPTGAGSGRIFCHSFYSLAYSSSYFNPIWISYHLTRELAVGGDKTNRLNGKAFKGQAGLTPAQQGRHKDYKHPPYDRGHMTPADDAIDEPHQLDTFVITNVVPQTIELNERLRRYLEASVHRLARDEGEVYIVTGPIYRHAPPILMHKPRRPDRIRVPTYTFKAIYLPGRDLAIGFIAENTATPGCVTVPIDEVARQSGIEPFPSLPAATEAALPAFTLPQGDRVDLPDCHPAP